MSQELTAVRRREGRGAGLLGGGILAQVNSKLLAVLGRRLDVNELITIVPFVSDLPRAWVHSGSAERKKKKKMKRK